MAVVYLLDTNILIHLVRRDAVGVRIQETYDLLLMELRPAVSVVSAGELRSLTYQFRWGKAKTDKAIFLLDYFRRVSIDDSDVIEAYAVLDAYSESVGRSMGKNDLWIAATAMVTGAVILTTDKDFSHLSPALVKVIWVDPDQDNVSQQPA